MTSRTALAALSFVAWTLALPVLSPLLDGVSRAPGPSPASVVGQISAAVAVATWPGVVWALAALVAVVAWRRGRRSLAWALALMPGVSWAASFLVKVVVNRPRPEAVVQLVTASGSSYPSGHVTVMTATALAVAWAWTHTVNAPADPAPQPNRRLLPSVVAVAAITLVAANRFLLRAHYPTDIVAGVLLGITVVSVVFATLDRLGGDFDTADGVKLAT